MDSNGKLDMVLCYLHSQSEYKTRQDMFRDEIAANIDGVELEQILAYLEDEKMVKSKKAGNPLDPDGERIAYKIAFPGSRLLSEYGGYTGQSQKESNKRKRKRLERILLIGGTVGAGAYGIFEILRYFLGKKHLYLTIDYAFAILLFSGGICAGIAIALMLKQLVGHSRKSQ